jgi:hypothetical protein
MIVLLVREGTMLTPSAPETLLVTYRSSVEILAAIGAHPDAGFVILSDGIDPGDAERVAAALRARPARVIEVRSMRVDGAGASLLGAACTGVIAGFGLAGVAAAEAHLARVLPA